MNIDITNIRITTPPQILLLSFYSAYNLLQTFQAEVTRDTGSGSLTPLKMAMKNGVSYNHLLALTVLYFYT